MIFQAKELPTIEEIKERYKGVRGLEIETHPEDKNLVVSVSFKIPCIVCGKHHRVGSKPENRCGLALFGIVSSVVNEEEIL